MAQTMALISCWWHIYTVFVVLLWSSLCTRRGFLLSKACLCRQNALLVWTVRGESEQPRGLQMGPAVSTRVPESGHTRPDIAVRRSAFLHPRLVRRYCKHFIHFISGNKAHRPNTPRTCFLPAWELRLFTFLKDCLKKTTTTISTRQYAADIVYGLPSLKYLLFGPL